MEPPYEPDEEISKLLDRIRNGDKKAEDELLKLVYSELRQLAGRKMAGERPDHTLQPTALVHEVYLRIFRAPSAVSISGREHFLAIAATVMRQVLVDHARGKNAQRRGGEKVKVELDGAGLAAEQKPLDIIALDAALTRLEAIAPRPSRVVELHFFGGLTLDDAARLLNVSGKTAKRDWAAARAWLHKEIYGEPRTLG